MKAQDMLVQLQDTKGQYPLYLDSIGVQIVLDCLKEVKERRQESGNWSTEYENPNCDFCVFLDDTIARCEALFKVTKSENEHISDIAQYVALCTSNGSAEDIPF